MKYTAEIQAVENAGTGEARVTFKEIKRTTGAAWRTPGQAVALDVPLSQAEAFKIGRKAVIEVRLERES